MILKKILVVIVFTFISLLAISQRETPKNWHLLDYQTDGYYGISLDKAYQFLSEKNINPHPVIVAVVDGGIDTAQADLKNIIWNNKKEIPGNGVDDDYNGYVDDTHGWNFLGNKDGSCVNKASDEKSRVYYEFRDKYLNKEVDTTVMDNNQKYEYNTWLRAYQEMNGNNNDEMEVSFLEVLLDHLRKIDSVLQAAMNVKSYTVEDVEKFQPQTKDAKEAKFSYLSNMRVMEKSGTDVSTDIIKELDDYISGKKDAIDAKTNPPHNYRADFVRDNYFDINDKFYGNSNVKGPEAMHGTHVAGIIGAQRNNGIGMDGVANDVKIMSVRCVPDGDEYDKDIALGIFYAVNNGAKVINMSFGKSYSPEKRWVDSAVRYAALKDVLLVHAAGNEGDNSDEKNNYPSPYYLFTHTHAPNFITVGASGDGKERGSLVADFSNYGKEIVDVFAPGVKIYSTLPENKYGNLSGTSMASPVVTGVAALIREYFPDLTAVQVRQIIEQSVSVPDSSVLIYKPGPKAERVYLSDLCKTGGIVNAYNAVQLAYKMEETIFHSRKNKKHS